VKQKDFLLILIPAFILTVLWVIFSIYHNRVNSTLEDPLSSQIEPINGSFDTATIELIKARRKANPVYEISGEQIGEENEEAQEIEEASESAEILTETPELIEEEVVDEEEPLDENT
jgi:hypothetical protein